MVDGQKLTREKMSWVIWALFSRPRVAEIDLAIYHEMILAYADWPAPEVFRAKITLQHEQSDCISAKSNDHCPFG